jgi:hypothetical protein
MDIVTAVLILVLGVGLALVGWARPPQITRIGAILGAVVAVVAVVLLVLAIAG